MRSDKPYYKLREKMYLFEVTQEELGKVIGRGPNYIHKCLSEKNSFEVEEAYKILSFFDIPDEEFPIYFPRREVKSSVRDNRGRRKSSA